MDIYGIGAALVDTEIEVEDSDLQGFGIAKGVMTLVDEARQHELLELLSEHLVHSRRASGGSGANSIIAAAHFGASTYYSCKLANDDNGHFYLRDLQEAKVGFHPEAANNVGTTGKCLVFITPDAERTMNTFLGISEKISPQEIDAQILSSAQYAYIEGYLVTSSSGRPAAIQLREQAKTFGVKTALSLSDPAMVSFFKEGLLEMIGEGVDILFCNEAEALAFSATDNIDSACAALQRYAKTFAITRGAQGALLFDGTQRIAVAAPAVKAVDTNGAGDMFAGAFLYGLSQNWHYEKAGRFACLAAAKVVSQFGPRLAAAQHAELLQEFSRQHG